MIIPVLNEAELISECLLALQPLRERGHELIVVDGGSEDASVARAEGLCDVIRSEPGRAVQMHRGAEQAQGEMLLFLHVDTRLPAEAVLEDMAVHGELWGRFDVRLSGAGLLFRIIETSMNLRSRYTGIATGDQAMFVSRALYQRVGGFPPLALMEDIALSQALRAQHSPLCLRQRVTTSSRRWEQHGVLRTVLTMWCLRGLYACGVSPVRLAAWYYS